MEGNDENPRIEGETKEVQIQNNAGAMHENTPFYAIPTARSSPFLYKD